MWQFDVTNIPRGHDEKRTRTVKGEQVDYQEFVPDWLWLATASGEVIKSYWLPQNGKDGGRWLNFSKGSEPVAWMPFVKPAHPYEAAQEIDTAALEDA